MPWEEVTLVSLRKEFVQLAIKEGSNISELCKRFNISRKTGYKWIKRYLEKNDNGLYDESKKPLHSPKKTPIEMESAVLDVRKDNPVWGGRKIRQRLINLGYNNVPAASTITEILKRNNKIDKEESEKHKKWIRFEADNPNDLWQMDFKGWFKIKGGTCHPLTVLDDKSRFSLGIEACKNEQSLTVKERLTDIFRRYGMPKVILCDNGPPFGAASFSPYTKLGKWLIRIGIKVIHGRPYHPQTQGKDERFHRTLKAEVINYLEIDEIDLLCIQNKFDKWREKYNNERPHEALDLKVPMDVYCESKISFPEVLPQIEYSPGDIVRSVNSEGRVSYKGKQFRVGKGFIDDLVAIRLTKKENILEIYYCNQMIKKIDFEKV